MLGNTSINLIPNAAAAESYMPFIRVGDFHSAILRKTPRSYPFLDQELLSLQAGQQISTGFDLNFGNVLVDFQLSDGGREVQRMRLCF